MPIPLSRLFLYSAPRCYKVSGALIDDSARQAANFGTILAHLEWPPYE